MLCLILYYSAPAITDESHIRMKNKKTEFLPPYEEGIS
jgi:hypothetical protein